MRHFVAFATILCALAVVGSGQTAGTSAIAGNITDSSGAVVGGASVKAIEVATGETRKATSADNGTYMMPLLKPGTYRVEVSKSGFKQSTSGEIPVHVTETATVNLQLTVDRKSTRLNSSHKKASRMPSSA